jgi:Spy/CpxP family protein refolding chaperone
LKEREFGAYAAVAMAAKELAMRADQLEDVTSIKGERVEAIAKLVTSGERFEKVKPKVETANTDTYEKIAEMLTRTQRERLKELKGKAFGGKVDFLTLTSIVSPGWSVLTESQAAYVPELYGYYDFELRYLANRNVRAYELDVNATQSAAINEALERWEEEYKKLGEGAVTKAGGLHDLTAKVLEVLTAEQRKKFDELMINRRMLIGGRAAACSYPAIVSRFKLSPEQLRSLKEGNQPINVLTTAQAEALAKLPEPYDPLWLTVQDPVKDLLKESAARSKKEAYKVSAFARSFLVISDRLKLSDEQIKKLRELAEDEPKFFELIQRELGFADTAPVAGSGRSITPAGVVSDQYREAVEEQCWNVLDDKQKSTAKAIYGRRK